MKKTRDYRTVFASSQLFFWALVLLIPGMIEFLSTSSAPRALRVMLHAATMAGPMLLTYFLNYFVLVPKSLFHGKRGWYYVVNLMLIIAIPYLQISFSERAHDSVDGAVTNSWVWAFFVMALIQLMMIFLALGVRYIGRYYELRAELAEQRQKASEAELTWLKSQLNPHFLFNTLNNISSLTQIDPDAAQEGIGQLSDIMRYALYDTRDEFVPIGGEIDFMQNYIALMKLRCNEKTTVNVRMVVPDRGAGIAPLIFISLIENAFKHGVNVREASCIDIDLHAEGEDLVFVCSNSRLAPEGVVHFGSGIGLENMERRLELLYQDRYKYDYAENDGVYTVRLVIRGIFVGEGRSA